MKWVQSPAVDLTVGCGAWSLLFILMAYFYPTSGQTLALGFYKLAVFVNARDPRMPRLDGEMWICSESM